ncbi:MAG: oligosaccharide flippase family protein [Candidatus Heimdallarchaeaceae archaeon]
MAFNKIFTNQLPQENMGQYAVILTASTTLMTFAAIGFPTALSRYTVAFKSNGEIKNLKDLVFSGFVMFFFTEFVIVGILAVLYFTIGYLPWFLDTEPYIYSLLAIAGIVIMQLFSTMCYNIASSLQNNRYYAIPIIMRILLQIPFGIFFALFLNLGVFGLVLGLFLSESTVGLYSFFILVRDLGIGKFSFSKVKSIFSYSSPVYISNMLMRLFDLIVLFYIEYSFIETGESIIALYRYGALTIVNMLLILNNLFRTVYRPIIFKYFEKKQMETLRDLSVTIFRLYIFLIVPVALLFFGFSPILIKFLTNKNYLDSIVVIPFLMLALMFEQIRAIIAYGHALYYKNYWILVASVPSIIISIIVGIFAIPKFGLIGVGIVYSTLRIVQFSIQFIISQKYFKLEIGLKLVIKIIFSSLIAICVGALFYFYVFSNKTDLTMLASFTIATILYFLVALSLKLLTRRDIAFVKQQVEFYKKIKLIKNKK